MNLVALLRSVRAIKREKELASGGRPLAEARVDLLRQSKNSAGLAGAAQEVDPVRDLPCRVVDNTVAVALITGSSTALVGAIANILSWRASSQSRQVELARIDADIERLRIEHSEAERQHRQGSYHQFLMLLNDLDLLAGGYADLNEARYEDWMSRYYKMLIGLDIFAPRTVRDALDALDKVVAAFHEPLLGGLDTEDEWLDAFHQSWRTQRPAFMTAWDSLADAMRADVAAHLVQASP